MRDMFQKNGVVAERDFVNKGIRCNCVCPARVHTPFVDGFLAKNYPGKEAEMLLQSHEGVIRLLPALPPTWKRGSFRELWARGGFRVGADWQEGRLHHLRIHATTGGDCRILLRPGFSSTVALESFGDGVFVWRSAPGAVLELTSSARTCGSPTWA